MCKVIIGHVGSFMATLAKADEEEKKEEIFIFFFAPINFCCCFKIINSSAQGSRSELILCVWGDEEELSPIIAISHFFFTLLHLLRLLVKFVQAFRYFFMLSCLNLFNKYCILTFPRQYFPPNRPDRVYFSRARDIPTIVSQLSLSQRLPANYSLLRKKRSLSAKSPKNSFLKSQVRENHEKLHVENTTQHTTADATGHERSTALSFHWRVHSRLISLQFQRGKDEAIRYFFFRSPRKEQNGKYANFIGSSSFHHVWLIKKTFPSIIKECTFHKLYCQPKCIIKM